MHAMYAGQRRLSRARLLAALAAALASPALAVVPSEQPRSGPVVLVDGRLWPLTESRPLTEARAALQPNAAAAWDVFAATSGGIWTAFVDTVTGRIDYFEGSGLPWLPAGAATGGAAGGDEATLQLFESRARELLATLGPALGVDSARLALSRERSRRVTDSLWTVDFDYLLDGLPVEGAHVVFRVSHGRLIQLGTASLPAPDAVAPRFVVSRQSALLAVGRYLGGFPPEAVILDGGTQRLLPAHDTAASVLAPGPGRGVAAVWEILFLLPGQSATWRARVDAESGELRELYDVNRYGQATGGVYPQTSIPGSETPRPLPFVDLSTGGFANSAGTYAHGGGPLTSTLAGKHLRVDDTCGPISLAADNRGNLAFGASAGTDCATPGFGGAGNTHSSRSLYYHLSELQRTARGWFPGNLWLAGQLPAHGNLAQTCNAFWNGGSVNFFRSGDGCGNTGEIADVALHEIGHGLDAHDGSAAAGELGTGETYGDLTAVLATHDSCIGEGFFQNATCGPAGDPCLTCTGVRDLDWANRASGVPHTVANLVQPLCAHHDFYVGPCGAHAIAAGNYANRREGHCESLVGSEALWDVAARDLPAPGSIAAWTTLERLWYRSRPLARNSFLCDTSPPLWTSHGCGTDTYWRAMRAVDDDDGNLANGTPNSCRLFAAFARHSIACAADPAANVCFAACTPPPQPAPSIAGVDNNLVQLSWTSSGPGVVYDVYRSGAGCNAGFAKVAENLTATSFADGEVANYFDYSYRIVAHPAGNEACSASPSACVTGQPIPCITPGAPSITSASTAGDNAVAVSFTSGAPSAALYNVYRALGSCASNHGFAAVATGVAGSSYLDAGVSGTLTYAYRVTAMDETAVCESAPGVCAEVTATGPCNAAPLFDGAASAVNAEQPTCGVDLAWAAATALCGAGVAYDVFRGATPDFTPSPANRIAEAWRGTTYADRDQLVNRQSAHYVVRARHDSNDVADPNRAVRSATPTGPTTIETLVESFEAPGGFDLPGWQHANVVSSPVGAVDWAWVAGGSGSRGWFASEDEGPSGKVLVSPRFGIGAQTRLTFAHRFALQDSLPSLCEDGGTLQLSLDGGVTWQQTPVASFLGGEFVAPVDPTDGNPLGNQPAWCGRQMSGMSQVQVDLGAYAGVDEARVRWYEGDDRMDLAATPNGWFVDDVTIANARRTDACTSAVQLFGDGFESGDFSRWLGGASTLASR